MMTVMMLSSVLVVLAFLMPVIARARGVSPFVSTDWLQQNLENAKVVTVDTRQVEEYREGHIPGSVNSFFGSWVVESNNLLLELPAEGALTDLIGSLGITPGSTVVVVSAADNDYSRADATRVAWTMIMAGLRNVAVLDGGYAKWLREQKPVSTAERTPKAEVYKGQIDNDLLASKAYVMSRIGKSVILDNRDANVYFGASTEPFAPKAGHIKTAVNHFFRPGLGESPHEPHQSPACGWGPGSWAVWVDCRACAGGSYRRAGPQGHRSRRPLPPRPATGQWRLARHDWATGRHQCPGYVGAVERGGGAGR